MDQVKDDCFKNIIKASSEHNELTKLREENRKLKKQIKKFKVTLK